MAWSHLEIFVNGLVRISATRSVVSTLIKLKWPWLNCSASQLKLTLCVLSVSHAGWGTQRQDRDNRLIISHELYFKVWVQSYTQDVRTGVFPLVMFPTYLISSISRSKHVTVTLSSSIFLYLSLADPAWDCDSRPNKKPNNDSVGKPCARTAWFAATTSASVLLMAVDVCFLLNAFKGK